MPHNPGSDREAWSDPTARVDWLEGNVLVEDDDDYAEDAWLRPPSKQCGAPRGYRGFSVWRSDIHGTQIGYAMEREKDGTDSDRVDRTRLILKGSGLANLRAEGVSDFNALHRFRRWSNDNCARIDLAVDVLHPEITPVAFHELHQQRRMVTRLGKPALWGDKDEGQTFYLHGKQQMLRVYDKTAERKHRGGHTTLPDGVTRMEIELRGPWARRAFRDLTTISPDDWDEQFPQFVGGLFLAKCRPLDVPRPKRNPQRAPVWSPLAQALEDVKPVRLSTEELHRTVRAQIAAKFDHLANQLPFLRFIEEALGTAQFLQAVRHGKLGGANAYLATFMQENPDVLREMVTRIGMADLLEEETSDGREDE